MKVGDTSLERGIDSAKPSSVVARQIRREIFRSVLLYLVVAAVGITSVAAAEPGKSIEKPYSIRGYDSRIQEGIDLIYNLQFTEADRYFQSVIDREPENPLGYFFLAMVTWWRVLVDLEDRAHDEAFYRLLDDCIRVCDRRLAQDAEDFDAILFKAGAIGFRGRLRGDRGQFVRAASDGLKCLPLLNKSRTMEPTNKDILFGQGIYNYFAEVMPCRHPIIRPVMWFLPDGDRELGLGQLQEVAREGKYAKAEAAYFLVQIYRVFERNNRLALPYLEKLYKRYPENSLFHRYMARTLADVGDWERSVVLYEEVIRRSHEGRAGYRRKGLAEALYYIGKSHFYNGEMEAAQRKFARVDSLGGPEATGVSSHYLALSNLFLGTIEDLQGARESAVARYRRAEQLDGNGEARRLARKYLKEPYTRNRD